MINILYAVLVLFPAAALTFATIRTFKKHLEGHTGKKLIKSNALIFVTVLVISSLLAFSVAAADNDTQPAGTESSAATAETQESKEDTSNNKGLGLLAAGMVTSLAGIGGGIAVAAGAPAAIAATSEDSKNFGKSLIFVALGESIALYGVVISILILNKI